MPGPVWCPEAVSARDGLVPNGPMTIIIVSSVVDGAVPVSTPTISRADEGHGGEPWRFAEERPHPSRHDATERNASACSRGEVIVGARSAAENPLRRKRVERNGACCPTLAPSLAQTL